MGRDNISHYRINEPPKRYQGAGRIGKNKTHFILIYYTEKKENLERSREPEPCWGAGSTKTAKSKKGVKIKDAKGAGREDPLREVHKVPCDMVKQLVQIITMIPRSPSAPASLPPIPVFFVPLHTSSSHNPLAPTCIPLHVFSYPLPDWLEHLSPWQGFRQRCLFLSSQAIPSQVLSQRSGHAGLPGQLR